MTRNRHDRVVSHFGEDLDTNVELDGAVVDIPDGTTVHDALQLIIGVADDDEEPPPPLVSTNHPLTIHRDLVNQHPATAVAIDDGVAALGEDTLEGALEKLAANSGAGYGLSSVITNVSTGVKFDIEMPFAGSIEAVRLFADQTGSIELDLWKSAYPDLPPTVANSICGSTKPTINSEIKSQNTTLTDWTTDFEVGDVFRINVNSSSTLSRITMALRFLRKKPSRRTIQPGLIARTATAHAPSLAGGVKNISLANIASTVGSYAPTVAGGSECCRSACRGCADRPNGCFACTHHHRDSGRWRCLLHQPDRQRYDWNRSDRGPVEDARQVH